MKAESYAIAVISELTAYFAIRLFLATIRKMIGDMPLTDVICFERLLPRGSVFVASFLFLSIVILMICLRRNFNIRKALCVGALGRLASPKSHSNLYSVTLTEVFSNDVRRRKYFRTFSTQFRALFRNRAFSQYQL